MAWERGSIVQLSTLVLKHSGTRTTCNLIHPAEFAIVFVDRELTSSCLAVCVEFTNAGQNSFGISPPSMEARS